MPTQRRVRVVTGGHRVRLVGGQTSPLTDSAGNVLTDSSGEPLTATHMAIHERRVRVVT